MSRTLPVLMLIVLVGGCTQAPVPPREESTATRPAPQDDTSRRNEQFNRIAQQLRDPNGSRRLLALESFGSLPLDRANGEVKEHLLSSYRASFKDSDPALRRLAAGLALQRPQLRDAPTLTAALADTDLWTRTSAAAALWALKREPRARALLLSQLQDRQLDEKTRQGIAELVGRPELALDAATALEQVASDRTAPLSVRMSALNALSRIAPAREKPLARAVVCNAGEAVEVRLQFACSCGMEDRVMFRALLRLLDDPRVARQVSEELADHYSKRRFHRPWPAEWFGEGDVRRLVRILESDQNGDFPKELLDRLGVAAVPALREGLKQEKVPPRRRIVQVLGKLGPVARDAAPDLVKLLADKDAFLRRLAVDALGLIGPDARVAIIPLASAMQTEKEDRAPFARALGRIGVDAIPALKGLLGHAEPRVRSAACAALGIIGPEARSAATATLRRLAQTDPDIGVRKAALEALQQIAPKEAAEIISEK